MSKVIKLGEYKGIEVKVKKNPVTNEEIENEVQRMVAQGSTLIEKEGSVENGDVTTIDFEGFKEGVAFEGGKAEGFQLEIGSGQFIPGFEDQMIGMTKGETRELNLTFPENYGSAELAGADVVFKVTVHKIEIKKAAELNEEFVATFNIPEMKTVEDFKQQVKISLEAQHEQALNAEKENQVLGNLIENSEVEIDDADIERALQLQIKHMSMELSKQGIQLEQYLQMMGINEEALREQLKPNATQQATFEAIIDEIIKVENLQTSDKDANAQVEAIAQYNQVSAEDVLKQIQLEDLKRDMNRIQASQLILNHAKVIFE